MFEQQCEMKEEIVDILLLTHRCHVTKAPKMGHTGQCWGELVPRRIEPLPLFRLCVGQQSGVISDLGCSNGTDHVVHVPGVDGIRETTVDRGTEGH